MQVACLVVLALNGMAQVGVGEPSLVPVAPFPLAAFLWSLGANDRARMTLAVAAALVTFVVYALVIGPWQREMGVARRMVAAARGRNDAAAEAGA